WRPGLLPGPEPVGHGQAAPAHRRGARGTGPCAGAVEQRAAARCGGPAAGRRGGQRRRRATGPQVPHLAPIPGPAAAAGAAPAAGVLRTSITRIYRAYPDVPYISNVGRQPGEVHERVRVLGPARGDLHRDIGSRGSQGWLVSTTWPDEAGLPSSGSWVTVIAG